MKTPKRHANRATMTKSKNVAARRKSSKLPVLPKIDVNAEAARATKELATLTDVRDIRRLADDTERMKKIVGVATGKRVDINKLARPLLAAVVKGGLVLEEMERRRGDDGVTRSNAVKTVPPTLKELGFTRSRAAKWRLATKLPDDEREALFDQIEASDDGLLTLAELLRAVRRKAKAEEKYDLAAAAFNADGPFGTVVIDWPWPMQKIDRDVRPNQDAFDYPTMTIDEMREFWTKEIEPRIEPDCHLFCWTTQKFLRDAINLVEQCGFRYVLEMVWLKPGGFQPVGLPQYNVEFVIYARRGTPIFIDTKDFNCGFEAPRREHSRKPAKFYETIARVTGGSRLDVFARERHPGFAQYGNEVDKFDDLKKWSTAPVDDLLAAFLRDIGRQRDQHLAALAGSC